MDNQNNMITTILKNVTKKRKNTSSKTNQSYEYIRCLNTLDLSALGIASTIGSAVYILIGKFARDLAGPSLVFSFALAGISALLSGICYAEFGCRVPKAGSAYVYTYVALGEIWAFITGWNMILEYIIAMSALSRACSEYINSLSGGAIYGVFMDKLGWWDSPALAKFPDFLALSIVILISIIIGLGVKQSSFFNNTVTFINIVVIIFALCVGSYYADTSNWSSWNKFAPYGFKGIITTAGSCFYAFAGFDVIGTAAEETIDPKKAIPRAILITISISFLAYFGISTVLTLMQPYNKLDKFAPLAEAFAQRGFSAGKYIIDVGAIASILSCLISVSFASSRVIHAMASDGLLFKWLDHINSMTHVPIRALLCSSTIGGLLAVLLNLEQLIEMLSIGTLTAYSLVAVAVLLTRYQCDVESVYDDSETTTEEKPNSNKAFVWLKTFCCREQEQDNKKNGTKYTKLTTFDNSSEEKSPTESENKDQPTEKSSFRASIATFVLSIALIILCIIVSHSYHEIELLKVWAILLTSASVVLAMVAIIYLYKQPMNSATFPFMVPCVPALPIIALFINSLLLVNLNHWTYMRFGVWMVIGFLIYGIVYGRNKSYETNGQSAENDVERESIWWWLLVRKIYEIRNEKTFIKRLVVKAARS